MVRKKNKKNTWK